MRALTVALLAALLVPLIPCCGAETALFSADFETDTAGFATWDSTARLALNREPGVAHGGTAALELRFVQRPARPGAAGGREMPGSLICQFPQPSPELRGLSFAVSTAVSVPVIVVLAEGADGPRYVAIVWCEAGAWEEVSLSLDDFHLDTDGPPDPDGKLTPEKMAGLGIVDGSFLGLQADQTASLLYVDPPRTQVLRVDDLKVLSTAPPARLAAAPDTIALADYTFPLKAVQFIGAKDRTVEQDDTDDGGVALKLSYALPAQTVMVAVHVLRDGALAGASAIRFRARANGQTDLLVLLEERGKRPAGGKAGYIATTRIPAAAPWHTAQIPIGDFKPNGQTPDPNGKLDLELVDSLIIVDASALDENKPIRNTLWLADLAGVK